MDIQSIYAQRIAADGTIWWQEGGVTLCDFPEYSYPMGQRVLPDGTGGAVVVWYNNWDLKGVYARRVNGIGNASPTDAGEHPPAPFFASNYPNPFNPATAITFGLPEPAYVELVVYDASGRRVRTLLGRTMNAGRHEAFWDGCDGQGSPVASGVYFYRLEAGDHILKGKMVLLR